jgi:integrase
VNCCWTAHWLAGTARAQRQLADDLPAPRFSRPPGSPATVGVGFWGQVTATLEFGGPDPVLAATPPRWRPLLAAAVYSGLRKGELLGLRKNDIDLPNRLIIVNCSYDRETTKGGRAEAIPIAAELMPYLRTAVKASPSDLLFPDLQGKMLSRHTPLEEVLRRALAHAGIVEGWEHVCRKPACGHAELAPDDQLRRCPRHGMKLWPKAKVRQIRFHDLRHTTASLLMMAGVNPGAVQRILRHSDPRITTETYGHLQPDYLRQRDRSPSLQHGAGGRSVQRFAAVSSA